MERELLVCCGENEDEGNGEKIKKRNKRQKTRR
jgi:hypothetical protein